MSTSLPQIKNDKSTCQSCGKEFSCGANAGKCWCFEIDLKAETLAQLKKDFTKCVCEDCLVYAEKEK
jgi:hypothetical protein